MEAISPTPTDSRDDSLYSNKQQLLKQIELIDFELSKCESNIRRLETTARDLEAATHRSDGEEEGQEEENKGRSQSHVQKIYAENKVCVGLQGK